MNFGSVLDLEFTPRSQIHTVVYPIDIQTYLTQGPLGDRHTESWGA